MISRAYYETIVKKGSSDARMIDMARQMGKPNAQKATDFVDALSELQVACGVDSLKMSDYGILYEELPAYVDNAFDNMGGLFSVDPCELTKADCLAIYQKSYR